MATVRFYGLGDTQSTSIDHFVFSSFVADSSTAYFFTNSFGERVKLFGTGITVDGAGRFVSGTINEIRVAPNSSSPNAVELRITDINIDGTDIMGSGGSGIPSPIDKWATILDGETEFFATNSSNAYLIGDKRDVVNELFYGDNDNFFGAYGANSTALGDFEVVGSAAQAIGGDDVFDVASYQVYGDASYVEFSGTLIGGNDTIIMRAGNYNSTIAGGSIYIYGDIGGQFDSSTLIGGDDLIDASKVDVNDFVAIYGDLQAGFNSSTFFGGDDTIIGSRSSNNFIYGDASTHNSGGTRIGGDDIITGGNANDVLFGDFNSTTHGNGGHDKINGLGGDDTMYGAEGRDIFFKTTGSATMYGGSQNDQFRPNDDGAHTFYGGSGDDILNYIKADGGRLTVDLNDDSRGTGWAADDAFSSVTHVVGSATQNNFLYGNGAGNILQGGAKSDRVEGRGGGDQISTLGGNDRIEAHFGANTYDGGAGFDILSYAASGSGVQVDLFNGTAKNGHASGDVITGIEHLYGSSKNDKFWGDNARNILNGFSGEDQLFGRNNDDALYGGANNDRLFGGFGNDIIQGGTGNDWIEGDRNNDFMRGGTGQDTFHYDRGDDIDRIYDFQDNVDTIELDGFGSGYKPFMNAKQVGNDVVFNFGNGDQLIVENIQAQQLFNDLVLV